MWTQGSFLHRSSSCLLYTSRTGWLQAVPDSEMHSSAHDAGSVYWYYSTSAGKTAVSEFRTIDGKTYAFNEYGELVTGLKKVKVDSSRCV